MIAFNSTAAQRTRILNFLRKNPLDTLTESKNWDVMHPAARVMELRKQGIRIKAIKIDRFSDCGDFRSMACYVLEVGAVAPAPADKTAGIHSQEIDTSEDSTGGEI